MQGIETTDIMKIAIGVYEGPSRCNDVVIKTAFYGDVLIYNILNGVLNVLGTYIYSTKYQI